MRAKAIRFALNILEDLLLLVLAADLLYLYYAGAWYDPYPVILLTELAILWMLIPFSLWRFFCHIREVDNETRKGD